MISIYLSLKDIEIDFLEFHKWSRKRQISHCLFAHDDENNLTLKEYNKLFLCSLKFLSNSSDWEIMDCRKNGRKK